MAKKLKCYRVCIGYIDNSGDDISNMDAKVVLARDVLEAVKKAKLTGRRYVEQVTLLQAIDVV